MESTSPTGLELELGGACDDGAPSPVMSETLGVVVNGGVDSRVTGQTSSNSDIHTTASTTSAGNTSVHTNGTHALISTPMFGVTSVTDFLNAVTKTDPSLSGPGSVVSAMTPTSQQHQNSSSLTFCRLGRRVGDVHRHFSYCIRDGKEYGMCVYCGHTLQRNTTRQKHHLSTHCPHAPLEIKARYDQERNSIHTRPAIEFQRKRSIELAAGTNMYPNEMEGSVPISTIDIPVKVERLEERLEAAAASLGKPEKTVLRMAELEEEEDPTLPPVSISGNQLPNPSIYSSMTRREMEASSASESRFRKPLKLWDHSRRFKKGIVVSSLRELLVRGCAKLNIPMHEEAVRPVLEEDGTEVDDEEYLEYLPDNTTILLLRPGEEWKPPGPYDDALVRSRHIRHRDVYRLSDRRDL